MMDWRSMKTAPRDGMNVYVTVDWFGARHTMDAYYQSDVQAWICDGEIVPSFGVLAWTPIPTPYTGTIEDLTASAATADPRDAEIARLRAEVARLAEKVAEVTASDEESLGMYRRLRDRAEMDAVAAEQQIALLRIENARLREAMTKTG